ncbi:MAG: hypothetical protein QM681_13570 [Novosphingobium sp.]
MIIQPIQEAVVSTFDIERLAAPLTQVCGYDRVDLPDAPAAQFAAWHVPAECTRIEQALFVPQDTEQGRGALRLVRFHGVDQKVMRSSQRTWDTGGIFDVDMFSADVDAVYRGLQRHGWMAFGEPVDYSEAHFSVRQVVAIGPDGLNLAVIQRYSPEVPGLDPSGRLSPVFNSTQMVEDIEGAIAFYVDVLGWHKDLDFMVEGVAEPGADVLGLPLPAAIGAKRRVVIFNPPGPSVGGVELIHNAAMHGRRCDADCAAPNIGILCLRFEVEDAPAYAAAIVGRGGALYAEPAAIEIAPYGTVTQFAVRSPEGAIVEFFSHGA